MTQKEDKKEQDTLQSFEKNPYDPEHKGPADIVRLFYAHDLPIIPVISKRGILIGVLKKDDVISELSDLDRVGKQKIDDFITGTAQKMGLDELLEYGGIKQFIVINIFGEVQGTWPRLQLFIAAERHGDAAPSDNGVTEQKEEQVLEWLIYLILEHIPRPLYAVNKKGKTIFYNDLFEELYLNAKGEELDIAGVEKSLKSSASNDPVGKGAEGSSLFYNSDLKFHYEKIPLKSGGKRRGFLIFCMDDSSKEKGISLPGIQIGELPLRDTLNAFERKVIVDTLNIESDLTAAAKLLGITRKTLNARITKHGIMLDSKKQVNR